MKTLSLNNNTPVIDLHCHSLCSDGMLSPEDLVDRAAVMGVTTLALTDHDTLAGISAARLQAKHYGMQIISGIEFSSVWKGVGIHIVGLGFDEHHPVILEAVANQEARRQQRAETIAQRLEKKGVKGIWEKTLSIANGAQVGRPHFAQALIELGEVSNMAQAFKKYLGAGKPGDVKMLWPEMHEVISWLEQSGGVAVIAHPDKYKLTGSKLKCLISVFKDAGGHGIEVAGGNMESSFAARMAQHCEEFQLMGSQGSDFHGPKPWSELGKFSRMPANVTPVWQHWN